MQESRQSLLVCLITLLHSTHEWWRASWTKVKIVKYLTDVILCSNNKSLTYIKPKYLVAGRAVNPINRLLT